MDNAEKSPLKIACNLRKRLAVKESGEAAKRTASRLAKFAPRSGTDFAVRKLLLNKEFLMSFAELFLVAVGLSADAFAVAAADGISLKRRSKALLIAFMFGLFQALMPLLGYLLGAGVAEYITRFDHFLALGVLGVIGGKMIFESVRELRVGDLEIPENPAAKDVGLWALLLQAVATSIDAFMVGVSFAAIRVKMLPAAVIIGAVTFALSLMGAVGGKKLGGRLGSKAELIGGIVLVIIGIKTFLEHVL